MKFAVSRLERIEKLVPYEMVISCAKTTAYWWSFSKCMSSFKDLSVPIIYVRCKEILTIRVGYSRLTT